MYFEACPNSNPMAIGLWGEDTLRSYCPGCTLAISKVRSSLARLMPPGKGKLPAFDMSITRSPLAETSPPSATNLSPYGDPRPDGHHHVLDIGFTQVKGFHHCRAGPEATTAGSFHKGHQLVAVRDQPCQAKAPVATDLVAATAEEHRGLLCPRTDETAGDWSARRQIQHFTAHAEGGYLLHLDVHSGHFTSLADRDPLRVLRPEGVRVEHGSKAGFLVIEAAPHRLNEVTARC